MSASTEYLSSGDAKNHVTDVTCRGHVLESHNYVYGSNSFRGDLMCKPSSKHRNACWGVQLNMYLLLVWEHSPRGATASVNSFLSDLLACRV